MHWLYRSSSCVLVLWVLHVVTSVTYCKLSAAAWGTDAPLGVSRVAGVTGVSYMGVTGATCTTGATPR